MSAENPGSTHESLVKRTAKASVVATLGLSAIATIGANMEHQAPEPAVAGISVEAGMQDVIPGPSKLNWPGVRLDVNKIDPAVQRTTVTEVPKVEIGEQQTNTDEVHVQSMKWAELFDQDPNAEKPADAMLGINDALDQINELQKQGYTIDAIKIHGYASDDDKHGWETGDGNPGFGIKSADNKRLAEVRSIAVADILGKALDQVDPSIKQQIELTGGTEVQDPILANEINNLAETLGVTAQDLVVQYNRAPDSLPANEREIMDQLAAHRYVGIEVVGSKPIVTKDISYDKDITTENSKQHHKLSIVLVPVILPVFKKTSNEEVPKAAAFPLSSPPVPVPGATPFWAERADARPAKNKTQAGYGSTARHRVQPGQLNNGGGSGTRGQRGVYKASSYQRRSGRS